MLPLRDQRGEGGLARQALLGRGALGPVEHAERIFGGEQFVVRQRAMVEGLAHRSRHAFSLIIARLIQLFIVPSGTFMRVANSS